MTLFGYLILISMEFYDFKSLAFKSVLGKMKEDSLLRPIFPKMCMYMCTCKSMFRGTLD